MLTEEQESRKPTSRYWKCSICKEPIDYETKKPALPRAGAEQLMMNFPCPRCEQPKTEVIAGDPDYEWNIVEPPPGVTSELRDITEYKQAQHARMLKPVVEKVEPMKMPKELENYLLGEDEG
jgi:hypothetical protein